MDAFQGVKKETKSRLEAIQRSLTRQAPINVGFGLNRVPMKAASVLRALYRGGAFGGDGNCVLLGTNAIYAYETMMGAVCAGSVLETIDLDILVDTRRRIDIGVATDGRVNTFNLVTSADGSFKRHYRRAYSLTGADGYDVEFIKATQSPPWRKERAPLDPQDVEPADIKELAWFVNAPKVDAVAVDAKGFPLLMRTVDPLAFCVYKSWMSNQRSRDPLKGRRDRAQASTVAKMMIATGYATKFDLSAVTYMPRDVVEAAGWLVDEAMSAIEGEAVKHGF